MQSEGEIKIAWNIIETVEVERCIPIQGSNICGNVNKLHMAEKEVRIVKDNS